MLSNFDRQNIEGILFDTTSRYNWMTCYTLRFLHMAIAKGAVELPLLYEIYPDEMEALLDYYGWPQVEKDTMKKSWRNQAEQVRKALVK